MPKDVTVIDSPYRSIGVLLEYVCWLNTNNPSRYCSCIIETHLEWARTRYEACVHPGCSMDNWILRRPATSDHEVAGKTKWLLILAIYNGNNMIYWDYWDNIMGIYIYIYYMLYWNNILEYSWQQQWVIQIIWPVDKLFGLNGSWTPSGYSITSQIMWVYNPCYWNQS